MMTPQQKIKHMILLAVARMLNAAPPEVTAENVDDMYDEADEDYVQDAKYEIRHGDVETDIPCEWSRYYESKSVASKAPDGSWVGWTYWYGGGKHGEPEAVEWMNSAYDLTCQEEEKMVVVRTFDKVEQPA